MVLQGSPRELLAAPTVWRLLLSVGILLANLTLANTSPSSCFGLPIALRSLST